MFDCASFTQLLYYMHDFKRNLNRKSLRLPNCDYTQTGAFFITMITKNRECLFGSVFQSEIRLSPLGNIVNDVWQSIPLHFPQATVNHFVIMPNHIHGIISMAGARHMPQQNFEQFGKPVSGSIPTIIRSFKSEVTRRFNILRNSPGGKVWQRNFYERVIRDEEEFQKLSDYILANPLNWHEDQHFR